VSAYRPDTEGKLLVEWLRKDWGLFEHERMDDPRAKDLLAEIFDDGEIVRHKFSPSQDFEGNPLGDWEKLREELMYHNRFFPKADLNRERLVSLLFSLTLDEDEIPRLWHRGRIQAGDTPLQLADMGAPPSRIASHGRANPAGIPYLYLGSSPITAISELRPHAGETAYIAEFDTDAGLKLVDLRRPRKMVSPFLLEESADICRMRIDLPLLERLGNELTRPVLPQAAAIDYTPSQYLCEFVKNCGYDGVIYRSSVVPSGTNLALFNPEKAHSTSLSRHRVTRVLIEAELRED